MPELKIKRLPHSIGIQLPEFATTHAAGMDVRAAIHEPIVLKFMDRVLVPTGFIFEIPIGYEVQVRPRSGLAIKHGVTLVNTPGTIDSDYRGEVKVILINLGKDDFIINRGDRIAQLVLAPVVQLPILEIDIVTETERGEGGFGSTGTH